MTTRTTANIALLSAGLLALTGYLMVGISTNEPTTKSVGFGFCLLSMFLAGYGFGASENQEQLTHAEIITMRRLIAEENRGAEEVRSV